MVIKDEKLLAPLNRMVNNRLPNLGTSLQTKGI